MIGLERRNMDYRVNQNLVKEDELKNEAIDRQIVRRSDDLTKVIAMLGLKLFSEDEDPWVLLGKALTVEFHF
ncbi:MAG: hypothetical protein KR126chlam4_01262 [Candidatus Anoxychlamydiales bacterium]|nr:hypothetical protein [Candidatus Anoxychlamydiales bacterium]